MGTGPPPSSHRTLPPHPCAQGSKKHYCVNKHATRQQGGIDEACDELLKDGKVRGGGGAGG